MPFTFYGTGTTFYGQRDIWPDGSYVTTEWFAVFMMPVIPLRSLRVLETGDVTEAVVYSSKSFLIREEERLSVKQVLSVYLFALVYNGFMILAGYLLVITLLTDRNVHEPRYFAKALTCFGIALLLLAPWFIVWVIRALARSTVASPTTDLRQTSNSPHSQSPEQLARVARCGKCNVPLTRDEINGGTCPSCGAGLS